jgi:probable HAF family extracellular repeat protein
MVDLGTLGGSESAAFGINATGQVVGESETTDGSRHAVSWTRAGGIVDLKTLGGADSTATAVNERGQVIGYSTTSNQQTHAFVWTREGGMIDIGTLGGAASYPAAINAAGEVVGYSQTADGSQHPFTWTRSGGIVDLGFEGTATAVSPSGEVVGEAGGRAFTWTPQAGVTMLGTFGGDWSRALDVSPSGQVVGEASYAPHFQFGRAFSWTKTGGMVDLGTLEGSYASLATNVTRSGDVVASCQTRFDNGLGELFSHACMWTQEDGLTDLGTLGPPDHSESYAAAVSPNETVVGYSHNFVKTDDYFHLVWTHAFAWTRADGMTDLGTLGGTFSRATAVNARGDIAGQSSTADPTQAHAVVWQRR